MKIRELISNLFKNKSKEKLEIDKNKGISTIHPLFIQMKENASLYLLNNGIFNF